MDNFSTILEKFQGVSMEAKQAFSKRMEIFEVGKGAILVKEGEISNYLYYINEGSARSYYIRESREITVSFTLNGEFVTAMHSFITRRPSYEYIETLEKSKILKMSHDNLNQCFREYPELERSYMSSFTTLLFSISSLNFFVKLSETKKFRLDIG
jgi:CRP-like cAMP-binding protein